MRSKGEGRGTGVSSTLDYSRTETGTTLEEALLYVYQFVWIRVCTALPVLVEVVSPN